MKRIATTVAICLLFTIPTPASAAVKPGQNCKKLNQSVVSNGKKFTCTKSGKKLVWRPSQVLQPLQTPEIPTPASSKAAEPEIELTPTSAAKLGTRCLFAGSFVGLAEGPAECVGGNDQKLWTLIAKESDSVASRAYRFVVEKYLAAPEGNLAMDIRMDPNTPEWGKRIEKGMFAGARFWGTSPSGSAPVPTLISADLDWWPTQLDLVKDPGKEDYLKRLKSSTCQAGFHGGPNPFWSFAFRETKCLNNVGFKQVPAHEYTHYAQAVLSDSLNKQIPRVPWMEEGLASFIGGALGVFSDMGSDLRFGWAADLRGNQVALDFFSKDERAIYDSPQWGDIYPVGAIALEGFVALVGMEGVLNYYAEIKNGATTDKAMEKAFGLSVSLSAQLLNKYVDSVRAKSDWSLGELRNQWELAKKS
jgi:hypothetical protein